MANYFGRRSGFPALAYVASNTTSPLLCVLVIKINADHKLATISLQFTISIHDFYDEQIFTLICNADNLVPGANVLKPADAILSQGHLDHVARHSDPQLMSMYLTIKKHCPLRCPITSGSISAKHGLEAPFCQLVKLASATALHIVFDLKWIHLDNQKQLKTIIQQPELFGGCSAEHDETKYCLKDWSVFSPTENEPPGYPPSYTEVVNKRPRNASISSNELPPSKRLLQSTASTSYSNALGLQQAVEDAVKEILPDILRSILPGMLRDMLPQAFAASRSPTPPTKNAPSSEPQITSSPKSISSIRGILHAQAATQAKAQLRSILDEMVDQAFFLRSTTDDEFLENIQEHKLDIDSMKEDNMADLQREIDDKIAECKEHAAEIVNEAGEHMNEHAEETYNNLCVELDKFAKETKVGLKLNKEIPRSSARHDRKRRATSVPM